jgi:hypothetical protein
VVVRGAVGRQNRQVSPTLLRGRWVLVARLICSAVAALTLGLALIGFSIAVQRPELAAPDVVARALAQAGVPFHVPLFGLLLPVLVTYSGTAFIVFWRRSDDWVAMLFALALLTLGALLSQFVFALERAYPTVPGPGFVTNLACVLFILAVFVFPDGRFVPEWTRLPVLCLLPLLAYLDLAGLLRDLPSAATELPLWRFLATLLLGTGLCGLGLMAQIYRFRYVSGRVERQQTEWVLSSLVACFVLLLAGIGLPSLFWEPGEWFGWAMIAETLPVLLVPVSVAVERSCGTGSGTSTWSSTARWSTGP